VAFERARLRRGKSGCLAAREDQMRAIDVEEINAVDRVKRRRGDAFGGARVRSTVRPTCAMLRTCEQGSLDRLSACGVGVADRRGMTVGGIPKKRSGGTDDRCCETGELTGRHDVWLAAIGAVDSGRCE
jgi:hypothetical protein